MTKHYPLYCDDFTHHLSFPTRVLTFVAAIVVLAIFCATLSIANAKCPCRHKRHQGITRLHLEEHRSRETEEVRMYRDLGASDRENDLDENHHEHGYSCKEPVRGLGTQWIGMSGAFEAAKKDWMERVRYDIGEKYVDTTNAEHIVKRCSRVSIAKVAGQVTYRCEMIAKPCKADLEEVQSKSDK